MTIAADSTSPIQPRRFNLAEHFFVRKTDDVASSFDHIPFSLLVVVVHTVDFNGELFDMAGEVEDVGRLGMLATHFQTAYLFRMRHTPERNLRFRLPLAKFAGVFDGFRLVMFGSCVGRHALCSALPLAGLNSHCWQPAIAQ
ncbi:hypothetical protein Poly41_56400 [Novipirellula artificiosorum]|uniref:Uncharacterized protein n=1 Tax=Novipirellula artificiosorum TaxID=2528016 RepID=A0A5C6D6W9_9BACT|nr:hypothetical protein Poly41_56400 [Novipirellula artificiosorum]